MTKKIELGDPIIINGRKLSLSRAVKAGGYIFCTGQVPMKAVSYTHLRAHET